MINTHAGSATCGLRASFAHWFSQRKSQKRIRRLVRSMGLASAAICLSQASLAGSATGTTITHLQINATMGDYLFIAVSTSISGPPACSTNGVYQFALNLSTNQGQQTMALLL